ncbi:MAG: hypothetical protein R3261_13335 [Alphaproteobacteria bacterium]|nr:hypothetical protein [Alphaproteobacteria bacterium]
MKKLFKFSILALVGGILAACQTLPSGKGEYAGAEYVKNGFVGYTIARKSRPGVDAAMVVHPDTGAYSWYMAGGRSQQAVTRASEECQGCLLFARNGQIVWDNFNDKSKLEELSRNLKYDEAAQVRYITGESIEISTEQKAEFESAYLDYLNSDKKLSGAFAISKDGVHTGSSYVNFSYASGRNYVDLERKAMAICEALSSNNECFVYARNSDIYK